MTRHWKDLLKPTHFISIPINNKANQEIVRQFKRKTLTKYSAATYNIQEPHFLPKERLHYNLLEVNLNNPKKINLAKKLIQNALISAKEFTIKNKGLEPFPSTYKGKNCKNLDVRPDEETTAKFAEIADKIIREFRAYKLIPFHRHQKLYPSLKKIYFKAPIMDKRYLAKTRNEIRTVNNIHVHDLLKDPEMDIQLPSSIAETVTIAPLNGKETDEEGYFVNEIVVKLAKETETEVKDIVEIEDNDFDIAYERPYTKKRKNLEYSLNRKKIQEKKWKKEQTNYRQAMLDHLRTKTKNEVKRISSETNEVYKKYNIDITRLEEEDASFQDRPKPKDKIYLKR